MIFQAIGIGVLLYNLVYSLIVSFIDCDLELFFYEKFGKSPARLKGKVVFITGASSGIGEHIAITLAKYGVKLVLAARRKEELERVKKICIETSKGSLSDDDILILQMDVLDIASHETHFNSAIQHFGTVDILLNNAGRSQRAHWEDIKLSVDRAMFELNVFSVIHLSRIAVNYFNKKGSGHVAVTSSLAGVIVSTNSASYAGAKYAIHGYFNCLKMEKLGSNIAVSVLCPGPTFSNFLQESFTDKPEEKYGIGQRPTDRRMTTERCAQLCAVALANRLPESWMGVFPIMPMTYIYVHFPLLSRCFMRVIGAKILTKLRDSKETNVLTEVATV